MRTLREGETKCQNCGNCFNILSFRLRLCPDCIRKDFKKLKPLIEEVHLESRSRLIFPQPCQGMREG
jgi:Zn finger protein HypA/HybF involved in hydrogenase expression